MPSRALRRAVHVAAALALATAASCAAPTPFDPRDQPVLIPPRTIGTDGRLVEPDPYPTHGYIDFASSPPTDLVQLCVYPSYYARRLAQHPYFLVYDRELDRWDQWEVWAFETDAWSVGSHATRRTFGSLDDQEEARVVVRQYGTIRHQEGVGYIDGRIRERIVGAWTGDAARRIIDVLTRPTAYPFVETYRIWPGPNSNTYAAWVLAAAGEGVDLPARMVGKDWLGHLGSGLAVAHARTGLRGELLGLGATVGLLEGVELHLLGATFGVDVVPPALKTPFGRLGFPERR